MNLTGITVMSAHFKVIKNMLKERLQGMIA